MKKNIRFFIYLEEVLKKLEGKNIKHIKCNVENIDEVKKLAIYSKQKA